MRDPERIPEMLSMLGKIWDVCPDQRLGQLIVNLTRDQKTYRIRDPFRVEDDELMQVMRDIIAENNLGV